MRIWLPPIIFIMKGIRPVEYNSLSQRHLLERIETEGNFVDLYR